MSRSIHLDWISENSDWDGEGCLRWPFSNEDWYHSVNLGPGKWSKAHRLMCEAAHGPPPCHSMYTLHSCSNKWCVNPKHLRWGTPSENIKDAIRNGEIGVGSNSRRSILTEDDVRSARADRKNGMTYEQLSRKYGIAKGSIWHAVKGTQWGHVK